MSDCCLGPCFLRFKRKKGRQKKRKAKKVRCVVTCWHMERWPASDRRPIDCMQDTAKMLIIKPREAAPLRKVEVAVGPVKVAAARRELVQQLYPHAQALWQARKHQVGPPLAYLY